MSQEPELRKAGAQAQPPKTAPKEAPKGEITLEMVQEAAKQAVAAYIANNPPAPPVQVVPQDQPVQHITVQTDNNSYPQIRPRPYEMRAEDHMEVPVVYIVNQMTYSIAPLKINGKMYDTPGSNVLSFTTSSMRQEGEATIVESRLMVHDKAWCRAIEARPDFGRVITKKGVNTITQDGLRALAYDRWNKMLSGRSYNELNQMANEINARSATVVIPLTDHTATLRGNLVGYHVRMELDGEQKPATAEDFVAQTVAKA